MKDKPNNSFIILFCFILVFSFSQTLYTFSLHFIFIFSFCSAFLSNQVATAAAGRSRAFEKSQYSPLYSSSLIQVCIFYILCTFKEISLTLSFISSPLSIAFCVLCFAIFYQYLCMCVCTFVCVCVCVCVFVCSYGREQEVGRRLTI